MSWPHRAARTASVRAVVVFGLATFLLMLIAGGIFYRYFAHRWWYDAVVRTTPSVAHLYELLQSSGKYTDVVGDRLEADAGMRRQLSQELGRRYQRLSDAEGDVQTIMLSLGLLHQRLEVEHETLWQAIIQDAVGVDPDRRWAAAVLMAMWPWSPDHRNDTLELWRAYVANLDQRERKVLGPYPWSLGMVLPARISERCDARIIQWISDSEAAGGNHQDVVDALCPRLQLNPEAGDLSAVLSLAEQAPSPHIDQMLGAIARRGDQAGACLDLTVKRPELAPMIWSCFLLADPPPVNQAIAERWGQVQATLSVGLDGSAVCPVIKILKESGDARYAPWLCEQLPQAKDPHRHELIHAIGMLGAATDADILTQYLFDPNTRRIAGWSIRRLDGARIQSVLIDELWTDADPLARLEAISAVSEDDPFAAILSDPRLKAIDRTAPLYQALLVIGLTQDQRQHLESAIGDGDR